MSSVWIDSSSSTRRMVEVFGIGAFANARGCRRAYYSPAMEAAPPRTRGRRLRRGTVERPLNARLVRVSFVVVAPAVLAFLFSISTTGTLQRSSLEPLFDGESAASLAATLDTEFPRACPGLRAQPTRRCGTRRPSGHSGLTTATDTWTEDIPDLGSVELNNVVTTVPGRSDETIVVVAHRDNAGTDQALGDNASGNGRPPRARARVRAPERRSRSAPATHARVRLHRRRRVWRRWGGALCRNVSARAVRDRRRRARWHRRARSATHRDRRRLARLTCPRSRAYRCASCRGARRRRARAAVGSVAAGGPRAAICRRRAGTVPRSRDRGRDPHDGRSRSPSGSGRRP